ncbi:hypothetical protein ACI784_10855 [Geodermatophilus sp. SYSU D01186]
MGDFFQGVVGALAGVPVFMIGLWVLGVVLLPFGGIRVWLNGWLRWEAVLRAASYVNVLVGVLNVLAASSDSGNGSAALAAGHLPTAVAVAVLVHRQLDGRGIRIRHRV